MYHGKPLCKTVDGNILWEFPGGKTGVISYPDARYLTLLNLGRVTTDSRKYIDVIQ